MRQLRTFGLAAALALAGSGCGQAPSPTPIKLVATNTLGFDIFVPDAIGQLGLAIGHGDASGFAAISEGPACDCQRCENACGELDCDCSPTGRARRIHPGASVTRTFTGDVFEASRADCGTGDLGPICFEAGAPLASGTYALQLCYAGNAPGADQGQDEFATTFDPASLTCITKAFTYPDQTEWVISPPKPPPCDAAHACPSGELCQQGVCSASCLANAVPPLGSGWTVSSTVVFDAAFFSRAGNRLTGSGTVGVVSFGSSVLDLPLRRDADRAQAELFIALPPTVTTVPLTAGQAVSVVVIPQTDDPESPSAVVVRDGAGALVLAAELDQGTPVLNATDLAPFTVNPSGTPFACDSSSLCGRKLHTSVLFGLDARETEVQPGQSVKLTSGTSSWNATAVANFALPDDAPSVRECAQRRAFGYAIVAGRQP